MSTKQKRNEIVNMLNAINAALSELESPRKYNVCRANNRYELEELDAITGKCNRTVRATDKIGEIHLAVYTMQQVICQLENDLRQQ